FIGLNSMSRPRRGKAATWRYPNKDGSVQFGFDLVIKTGRPFRELGVDLFSKSLERSAVDIDDFDTGFLHLFDHFIVFFDRQLLAVETRIISGLVDHLELFFRQRGEEGFAANDERHVGQIADLAQIFGFFLELLAVENRNRVFDAVDHTLRQRREGFAERHRGRRSAHGVEGLDLHGVGRHADLRALEVFRGADRLLGNDLANAVKIVRHYDVNALLLQLFALLLEPGTVIDLEKLRR